MLLLVCHCLITNSCNSWRLITTLLLDHLSRWCFGSCFTPTHSASSSTVLFSVRGWCYSHPGLANCPSHLCILLVHLKNKTKICCRISVSTLPYDIQKSNIPPYFTKNLSVAEFPCQHSHTIFRKDVWRHINWFALFRVTWYDFQEVKWILVSLSDMQQKRDNSNENTWKLNETFSHLNNPIYSISNKFTYV